MNWKEIPSGVPVMVTMDGIEYYPHNFIAPFIGVDNNLLVLRVAHVWRGGDDTTYDSFPECTCRLATLKEVKDYECI